MIEVMKNYKRYIWISADNNIKDWKEELLYLKAKRFDGIVFSGDFEQTEKISEIALSLQLEFHVWFITLLNNNDQLITDHPEYFMINKIEISILHQPPYVEYYKWLCPNNPQVRDYLLSQLKSYCKIRNITGIQLDYIRYPDVILPPACQREYSLVQEKEEPQYDYCYCSNCRQEFLSSTGIDPLKIIEAAQAYTWLQFRLNTISRFVKEISQLVRSYGKQISAAVFPTPKIARELVRQDWLNWGLDAYFPMVYHNFYDRNINWIGKVVEEIKPKLRESELYPGIYLPSISASDIDYIDGMVKKNGAGGISWFDYKYLKTRSEYFFPG